MGLNLFDKKIPRLLWFISDKLIASKKIHRFLLWYRMIFSSAKKPGMYPVKDIRTE